jgi:hypothetical protein
MDKDKINLLIETLKYTNDHDGEYRGLVLKQIMIEFGIMVQEKRVKNIANSK